MKTNYIELRDGNAAHWSHLASKHGTNLVATASTPWVRAASLRRLKRFIKPTDRVLEVGCGNGSSLLGPLTDYCQMHGVDITAEMIETARKTFPKAVSLQRADACALPFDSRSFDVVYTSRCVINVMTADMQTIALREIFRVVKPGGTVVLIENFDAPVASMNRAREVVGLPPLVDAHNLRLNLTRTIECARLRGWTAKTGYSNTCASFIANVLVAKLTQRRGGSTAGRILHPLYVSLCWMEDHLPTLPLFGKDTAVVFKGRVI